MSAHEHVWGDPVFVSETKGEDGSVIVTERVECACGWTELRNRYLAPRID